MAGFFGFPASSIGYGMAGKNKIRPRDPNQLAKLIVDLSVGNAEELPAPIPVDDGKDPAAVALGRRGGLKGGKARAKALSPKRRKAIAKKAAKARWG